MAATQAVGVVDDRQIVAISPLLLLQLLPTLWTVEKCFQMKT